MDEIFSRNRNFRDVVKILIVSSQRLFNGNNRRYSDRNACKILFPIIKIARERKEESNEKIEFLLFVNVKRTTQNSR